MESNDEEEMLERYESAAQPLLNALPRILFAPDEVTKTPSSLDSVALEAERLERYLACQHARDLLKHLCLQEGRSSDTMVRAQVVACYCIQLLYQFRSLAQEDRRLVAVAAAFLACKVADTAMKMGPFLRTVSQVRANSGEGEFTDEEQQLLRDEILRIEFLLVRIVRFHVLVEIPMEKMRQLAKALLPELAELPMVQEKRRTSNDADVAHKLVQAGAAFAMDVFMSFIPLFATPTVIAATLVIRGLIQWQAIKEIPAIDDVARRLNKIDPDVELHLLRRAVRELNIVARMKTTQSRASSAPSAVAKTHVAPTAAATAPAVSVRAATAPAAAAQPTAVPAGLMASARPLPTAPPPLPQPSAIPLPVAATSHSCTGGPATPSETPPATTPVGTPVTLSHANRGGADKVLGYSPVRDDHGVRHRRADPYAA